MHSTDITKAFVGLGSNMGDAPAHLRDAVAALQSTEGIHSVAVSPVYLTEPQDDAAQPWFANQVARLVCAPWITPEGLLEELFSIESKLGRLRDGSRRYGPRVIDLDLLLFGQATRSDPALTLPHPRMTRRAFVLVPLHALESGCVLPDGTAVADLLHDLPHRVAGNRIYQPTPAEAAC